MIPYSYRGLHVAEATRTVRHWPLADLLAVVKCAGNNQYNIEVAAGHELVRRVEGSTGALNVIGTPPYDTGPAGELGEPDDGGAGLRIAT